VHHASGRLSLRSMRVTVLLFASYADALGRDALTLDVGPGATVGDVLAEIRRGPGGDRLPPSPAVAVNQRYARLADAVAAGDEVAIIPPVAGG
jgi:molybdopterin converting factor small subunit